MKLIQQIAESADPLSFNFGSKILGPVFMMLSNIQITGMRATTTDDKVATWCSNSVSRITSPSKLGDYFDPANFDKRMTAILKPLPDINFNDRTLFLVIDCKSMQNIYDKHYGEFMGFLTSMNYNYNSGNLDLFFTLSPSSGLGLCDMIFTQKDGRIYHKPPNSSKVVVVFRVGIEKILGTALQHKLLEAPIPDYLKFYEETIPKISIL